MYHATKNCENCDFKTEQFEEEIINKCILTGSAVGLLETCERHTLKTGNHITSNESR